MEDPPPRAPLPTSLPLHHHLHRLSLHHRPSLPPPLPLHTHKRNTCTNPRVPTHRLLLLPGGAHAGATGSSSAAPAAPSPPPPPLEWLGLAHCRGLDRAVRQAASGGRADVTRACLQRLLADEESEREREALEQAKKGNGRAKGAASPRWQQQ